MKRLKLFAALILLCVATLFTGCGVQKEEADVILESWSEDGETSEDIVNEEKASEEENLDE